MFIEWIVEVEFGKNVEINMWIIVECGIIVVFGLVKEMIFVLLFYLLMFKVVIIDLVLVYFLLEDEWC